MSDVWSLAVAQTCPVRGDVDANVSEHLRLIELASQAGAQGVVFPELSLTGYELDLADALAFAEDDTRLRPLRDAAAAASLVVIAGAPVRIDDRLHLAACILHPDRTVALYTKRRLGAFGPAAAVDGTLPPAEATVFRAGDRDPSVRVGSRRGAVAICADIGDPAHPDTAAQRGAEVYLASMFVIPSEYDGDAVRLQGYAVRHGMAVALANFGSPTGGLAAAGRSAIWSETGELLVRLPPAGAGVAVATRDAGRWRATEILLHPATT